MGELTLEVGGVTLPLDEDGFLQEPDLWTEEFARVIAAEEEVASVTEEHWKIINYIRDYYLKHQIAPMVRRLCKETGFNLKKVYDLFPSGPAKGACKLAGLPRPTGCV